MLDFYSTCLVIVWILQACTTLQSKFVKLYKQVKTKCVYNDANCFLQKCKGIEW